MEELVILPREYSSPTPEVFEALCNMQEGLNGGEKDEGYNISEGIDALKLRNLVVTYYSAGPKPCHCVHEFHLSDDGEIEVNYTRDETYPSNDEGWNVTHLFRRFLDTFSASHLSICSCCETPAGIVTFLESLSESQRARVEHHSYRAKSGRVRQGT